MCKFHKEVAIQVATGSDGVLDQTRYGIVICALWRYWIDSYMPEMSHLYGYSTYEMATSGAVEALHKAQDEGKLSADLPAIKAYAQENAPHLRAAVDAVIARHGLTLKTLNLPQKPTDNPRGVMNITEGLFEGEPAQGLNLLAKAKEARQEPMRRALEDLFAVEGFEETLRTMIAGSFVRLMTEAQEQVNPKLMGAYERLPYGLRSSFGSCALHGSGSTIGTHALCLMMPAAAGAFGMAASPLIAVTVDRALHWRQGYNFSWQRSASIAAISLAVAAGINAGWPHDHLNTAQAREFSQQSKQVQDVMTLEAHKRYVSLPENLRLRVDQQAAKKNITPEIYITICDGSDSLGRDIADFERKARAEPDHSWRTRLAKKFEL